MAHPHQPLADQHLAYLRQVTTPHRVPLVHQHQSPTAGAHNPWAAEAALEAHLQQGLVTVQDLERQRLAKLSQDSAASRPL